MSLFKSRPHEEARRDVAVEAESIMRQAEERRKQREVDHEVGIFNAVQAGEALSVFGVRYVPEESR